MQQKAGGMGQGWRRGVAAGLAMGLLAAAAQVVAVEAPRSDADAERFALRAELFEEYPPGAHGFTKVRTRMKFTPWSFRIWNRSFLTPPSQ